MFIQWKDNFYPNIDSGVFEFVRFNLEDSYPRGFFFCRNVELYLIQN